MIPGPRVFRFLRSPRSDDFTLGGVQCGANDRSRRWVRKERSGTRCLLTALVVLVSASVSVAAEEWTEWGDAPLYHLKRVLEP